MRHPYQCIHFCNSQGASSPKGFLVAAAGPSLFIFNLLDGSLMYQWSTQKGKAHEIETFKGTQEPPDSTPELQSHNHSNRDKRDEDTTGPSNVTKITSSRSGQHIVIATDFDKTIVVFQAVAHNKFVLLSKRQVSKIRVSCHL